MRTNESSPRPNLRLHRVKGEWKQITDEDVALIEAQLERLERFERTQAYRGADRWHIEKASRR